MNALQTVARVYLVLVGASGFLFGQLFFGHFSWTATLAGVSGVASGILGQRAATTAALITALVCAAGILGVAADAFHYYSELQIPGNDYASVLVGIFAAGLVLIGYLNVKSAYANVVV
jgi:hypothetical protein